MYTDRLQRGGGKGTLKEMSQRAYMHTSITRGHRQQSGESWGRAKWGEMGDVCMSIHNKQSPLKNRRGPVTQAMCVHPRRTVGGETGVQEHVPEGVRPTPSLAELLDSSYMQRGVGAGSKESSESGVMHQGYTFSLPSVLTGPESKSIQNS